MGRMVAVLTVGLALLLAAACGDGGGDVVDAPAGGSGDEPATADAAGTASVEEVCADIEEAFGTIDDGDEARDALFEAADAGDEAAIDEAREGYLAFAGGFADRLRDIAEGSADQRLRSALEAYAGELEVLAAEVAANPRERDSLEPSSGYEAAGREVNDICGFETAD